MNVLVTSISKKIPLLLAVKDACWRVEQGAKLIGADTNEQAIGRFFVDQFWHMPQLEKLTIEELIDYCQVFNIKAIIPTRDGELSFFSLNKSRLEAVGILVMVSEHKSVGRCLDKLHFYQYGKSLGYPVIETFSRVDEVNAESLVVKERYGAGSASLGLQLTKREAEMHAESLDNPLFQPFIKGREYSVDAYITSVGAVKGTVVRSRDVVVHGESQVTTTLRFPELEQLAQDFTRDFQLYGHIVLQVLEDGAGCLHIVECNSRFGGASTLSIAVGLDSFYWFLLEAAGENVATLPFKRAKKEKQLIRYPQDYIFEIEVEGK